MIIRKIAVALTAALILAGFVGGASAGAAPAPAFDPAVLVHAGSSVNGDELYEAVFKVDGALPEHSANAVLAQLGVPEAERDGRMAHVYRHAFPGFAVNLTLDELERVDQLDSPAFVAFQPSTLVTIPMLGTGDGEPVVMQGRDYEGPQVVPLGVQRVGATPGNYRNLVQVAVLDTGVDTHPDINLVGGFDATDDSPDIGYDYDPVGHGTWIAGRIGAIDNDNYVRGIVPGADIYSVKVLDEFGSGGSGDIIAGYDWLTAHADVIDVANMSFGGRRAPDTSVNLGVDLMHEAFSAAVKAGVVMVTAAGNDGSSADNFAPAGYEDGVTVGGFGDFDGQPGGAARAPLLSHDDGFAMFSNDGAVLDFLAPSIDELSLLPNLQIGNASGTSMAAPDPAGVIAAYKATHPGVSGPEAVEAVRNWSMAQDDEIAGYPFAGMFDTTPPVIAFGAP